MLSSDKITVPLEDKKEHIVKQGIHHALNVSAVRSEAAKLMKYSIEARFIQELCLG